MNDLMSTNINYGELITVKYAADIMKLSKYIRYFENKKGSDVASDYDGKQGTSKLKFPVFDSTLLTFTKEAAETSLMDPNYIYKYRKYRITTEAEEKAAIRNAKDKDIDLLRAILSRYVLEGRYKTGTWKEGAERGIFHDVLAKLVEMYEFHNIKH